MPAQGINNAPRMLQQTGHPIVGPDGLEEAKTPMYADEGCLFFARCEDCPLQSCLYEEESRGNSGVARATAAILDEWFLPGADQPQLFKAAEVCLATNPKKAIRQFGPEFMETLDDYRRTQSGR